MDVEMLAHLPPWDWPADSSETLISALRSGAADESTRLLAAEIAGESPDMGDELAEALVTVIRDGDEGDAIRSAAAVSLGPTLELLDTEPELFDEGPPVSARVGQAIREVLREIHMDADVPKLVRRRALEASVRAQEPWHPEAVRAAYHSGDDEWRLTAVFCMRFVRGFDQEILKALENADPLLRYEAMRAAGGWGVEAAWPYVRDTLMADDAEKPLLLAAIDAVATIRPEDAAEILDDLADSKDEEIAEAVSDALAMAGGLAEFPEDEELL